MVKATISTEDLICKKVGLCLDDSLASGDSRESRSMMEEVGFIQHFKAREKRDLEKSECQSGHSYFFKILLISYHTAKALHMDILYCSVLHIHPVGFSRVMMDSVNILL